MVAEELYALAEQRNPEVKELLSDTPHFLIAEGELVAIPRLAVNVDGKKGSIIIKNGVLPALQMTGEEVLRVAKNNMVEQNLFEINSLLGETMRLMQENGKDISDDFSEFFTENVPKAFIVSNKDRAYGAACLACPEIIGTAIQKMGIDCYIVPSSVHEVILVQTEEPAQKKTQTQQIVEKLEKGVSEVFESEQYKQYLTVISKFHSYSYNNILLIAMQCPGATMVAGFESWQRLFKRHVCKNEKAIKILAPCPYKKVIMQEVTDPVTHQPIKNSDGEVIKEKVQITVPAFRPVSVFDVSQTEGEPLPEMATVQELIGEVDGFDTMQEILENMAPCAIYHKDIEGTAKGYYSPSDNQIVIKNGLPQQQEIKTMIHEIAHSLLHNSEKMKDKKISRNDMEVQAESVAYTVCSAFGIDTSDYSFGYIAGWSQGKEIKELKNALDLICDTASTMIFHIENKLTEKYEEKYGKKHGESASIEITGEVEKAGKRKGMHI